MNDAKLFVHCFHSITDARLVVLLSLVPFQSESSIHKSTHQKHDTELNEDDHNVLLDRPWAKDNQIDQSTDDIGSEKKPSASLTRRQ